MNMSSVVGLLWSCWILQYLGVFGKSRMTQVMDHGAMESLHWGLSLGWEWLIYLLFWFLLVWEVYMFRVFHLWNVVCLWLFLNSTCHGASFTKRVASSSWVAHGSIHEDFSSLSRLGASFNYDIDPKIQFKHIIDPCLRKFSHIDVCEWARLPSAKKIASCGSSFEQIMADL